MTWDEVKQKGSRHYKTGRVEPIDLFKHTKPDASLTALDIKALTDCIKYAYRMLTTGVNFSDCDKIIHYIEMIRVCLQEKTTINVRTLDA